MTNPRCNWVRDRLPLLAGVELLGTERRRVERHLIGCARCREHRQALGRALDVLHAAAAEPPTDSGSLWPALARQIRESRRPSPAPGFSWASLFGLRPRFWPTFALTMSLLAALGATVALRQQTTAARTRIRWAARPLPPLDIRFRPVAPAPLPSRVVQTDPAPETAPPARYDYDLEHGTPMNPDLVEGKNSTKSATY